MIDCTSCIANQQKIKKLFTSCRTAEERYHKIIELGKNLPPFDPKEKTSDRIVSGCQSIVYLSTKMHQGKIFFNASSEALISAGLAALLIQTYNGEDPAILIKCPPHFLQELDILSSLSPTRSNGLANIYLRMQQEAAKLIV